MIGLFMGIFRRIFGGADCKFDFLEYRGVQMILCTFMVFAWEFWANNKPWYISLILGVLVYIYWCCGHWWWYTCGTENNAYIEEQLAKGRKPAMWWLVRPICKMLGFTDDRSRQYCFVGLTIRYTLYALPIAFLIGWHFMACALAVPFIYNAMFWVELPKFWKLESPTNWAEFFAGLAIGWGLW